MSETNSRFTGWLVLALVGGLAGALSLEGCGGTSGGTDGSGGSGGGGSSAGADGATDSSRDGDATSPSNDAAAHGDATTADASTSDAASDVAGMGDGGCEQLAVSPDFTRGYWLICNATDSTPGRIWTGTLTFTSETPTCDGANLVGSYSWKNNGGGTGTTVATGTYNATTHKFVITETSPTGSVISATDLMTYDPQTDTMVDGSWEPTDGKWSKAVRVVSDGGVPACTP